MTTINSRQAPAPRSMRWGANARVPAQQPRGDGTAIRRVTLCAYFTMLVIVYYFGVLYPSLTGGEGPALRYALGLLYAIGMAVAVLTRRPLRIDAVLWMALFAVCGAINVMGTDQRAEAAAQWTMVLGQFYIYYRLAIGFVFEDFKRILRWFGILTTGYVIFAVWLCRDEIGEQSYRWQTIAFYAGMSLLLGLFHTSWLRIVMMTVSVVALYLSASRGAVFAAALASMIVLFSKAYIRNIKWAAAGAFLVVIVGAISGRFTDLLEHFASVKSANDSGFFASMQRTVEGRLMLWQQAREIILENPLGIGLGQKYSIYGESTTYTVHNGYITTLLETGFCGLFVVLALLGVFWVRLGRLTREDARLGVILKSITVYYLTRAFYENYLMFNFANLVTNGFWLIVIYTMFRVTGSQVVRR